MVEPLDRPPSASLDSVAAGAAGSCRADPPGTCRPPNSSAIPGLTCGCRRDDGIAGYRQQDLVFRPVTIRRQLPMFASTLRISPPRLPLVRTRASSLLAWMRPRSPTSPRPCLHLHRPITPGSALNLYLRKQSGPRDLGRPQNRALIRTGVRGIRGALSLPVSR